MEIKIDKFLSIVAKIKEIYIIKFLKELRLYCQILDLMKKCQTNMLSCAFISWK